VTGKELESLRIGLDLSQRQFAEIVGVTRVTITLAEKKNPSRNLISFIDLALSKGLFRLSDRQTASSAKK
jgi:DNA-binding XRE family transcriptional regulator